MCVHEYMLEYVIIDVICIFWIYKCSIFPIKKDRSDFLSVFSGVWDDYKKTRHADQWYCGFFLLDCFFNVNFLKPANGCIIPRKWIVHYQLFLEEDSVKTILLKKIQCWIYNFITLQIGMKCIFLLNLDTLITIACIIIAVVMIIILTFLFSISTCFAKEMNCSLTSPVTARLSWITQSSPFTVELSTETVQGLKCNEGAVIFPCVYEFDITWNKQIVDWLFLSLERTSTTFDSLLFDAMSKTYSLFKRSLKHVKVETLKSLKTFDSAIFLCNCVHILFHGHW